MATGTSPVSETTDLVSLVVKVNGTEVDTVDILRTEVVKALNRVPYARIEIVDGSPDTEDFPISDSASFVPGNEIEILAGYHSDYSTIFKGIVIKQGIRVRSGKSSILVVECRDTAIKMTVGKMNSYYSDVTDSDVITTLTGNHGLSATVEATTTTYKSLVQYYSTDWDFMLARADANGQVVIISDGTVTVKKPDTSASPVLSIMYGDTLLGFEGDVDARNQYPSVQATMWDPGTQANVDVTSQSPGLAEPGNLTSSTLSSVLGLTNYALQTPANWLSASMQSWANALMIRSVLAKSTGKVRFQGNATALPGTMLTLAGLGARFNGNVYVTAIRHEVVDGNWLTDAEYGLPPETYAEQHPDITSLPASGLLPGTRGLQYGVVKQIDQDPDGQYRVLVNLTAVDPAGTGIWARLASFYATSGAGNFFYPEVDDEVILGFLNDDPNFAVILGSLYSSQKTPAYTPDQTNSIKAIVSKELIKIEFDDQNKVISILTPGNNKAILSDQNSSITLQDSSGNKVEMTSSGITLTSASAISIKAQTTVTIEGGTGITLTTSGGDVKMSGLNVNASADMALTAKGNLSAELSASGQTTVKGAIVMIN